MPVKMVRLICAMLIAFPVCIVAFHGDAAGWAVSLKIPPGVVPSSADCDVVGTGMGNVATDPKVFSCIVSSPQESTGITGIVVCGNPGKKLNQSPGINLAVLDTPFEEFQPVDPKNCDKHNGKCEQNVHAELTATQLASLNSACPNPNWIAKDFAACAATVTVQGIGLCHDGVTEGLITQATYDCTMLSCETAITFNAATQKFQGPSYQCTLRLQESNLC